MTSARARIRCRTNRTEAEIAAQRHIGQKLRLAREWRGLSQAELGALTNVVRQQISLYENGSTFVDAARLLTFSAALAVPIAYFFDGVSP